MAIQYGSRPLVALHRRSWKRLVEFNALQAWHYSQEAYIYSSLRQGHRQHIKNMQADEGRFPRYDHGTGPVKPLNMKLKLLIILKTLEHPGDIHVKSPTETRCAYQFTFSLRGVYDDDLSRLLGGGGVSGMLCLTWTMCWTWCCSAAAQSVQTRGPY